MELNKSSHSVYSLNYHLVQFVYANKKILENKKIVDMLKNQANNISKTFEVEITQIESDKDYFHMIFKAKPTLDITKYLNALKCITSREINRNFPEIKAQLEHGAFWSPSYFLATSGQVTIDILNEYIKNQRKKLK